MTQAVSWTLCRCQSGAMVPGEHFVCFDCQYPKARDRSWAAYELQAKLEAAEESLRDRFAMAALPFALEGLKREFGSMGGPFSVADMARKAYEIADAMLAERTPPIPPKESHDDPHP